MKLFEGVRPSAYLHGARLKKDNKTGQRYWSLTLVITLEAEDVAQCDDLVQDAWSYIADGKHKATSVDLGEDILQMFVEFYALPPSAGAQKPALRLGPCDLTGLRLTRVEGLTEMWVTIQSDLTDRLHAFVKEYAFTRVFVALEPAQMKLGGK